MYIWIKQTQYELRCHRSEDIRVVDSKDNRPSLIYAPAGCSIDRIEQYLQWHPTKAVDPNDDTLSPLVFDRIHIFDQFFPIKLQQQKDSKLKITQNMIYCDLQWYQRSREDRRKDFIVQRVFEYFILQFVGQWEDRLQVLAGTIKFRKMAKSYYKINRSSGDIIFNTRNAQMPMNCNEWLVAKALLCYCPILETGMAILKQKMPGYVELEKRLHYESK